MKPDKPFKTYSELIEKLRSVNGLQIDDVRFAENVLRNVSYYDLINGYKDCFQDKNERYLKGISVEYLFVFHEFDRSFENILMKYSLYVETRFKNILSYTLSQRFGVHQDMYLDSANFIKPKNAKQSNKKAKTLDSLREICAPHFNDQPSKHYNKYHNHTPPWILFKNANWALCADLYSLLKPAEKQEVVNQMIDIECKSDYKNELLSNSLYTVRKFRNKIAHPSKFITFLVPIRKTLLYRNLKQEFGCTLLKEIDFQSSTKGRDVYAMILSLLMLIGDPYRAGQFSREIQALLANLAADDAYDIWQRYSKVTGIPVDLVDRIKNYFVKKYGN